MASILCQLDKQDLELPIRQTSRSFWKKCLGWIKWSRKTHTKCGGWHHSMSWGFYRIKRGTWVMEHRHCISAPERDARNQLPPTPATTPSLMEWTGLQTTRQSKRFLNLLLSSIIFTAMRKVTDISGFVSLKRFFSQEIQGLLAISSRHLICSKSNQKHWFPTF